MTMTLDKCTVGIWFVQINQSTDWLLTVNKNDEEFTIEYRFRYYMDDKLGDDSDDVKNWYSGTVDRSKQTIEEVIEMTRKMMGFLVETSGGEGTELLMEDEDLDKFIAEFKALPFTHCREEPLN